MAAHEAVATSLAVVFVNALAGFAAHASAGSAFDYGVLAPFAGVAFAVSMIAARFGGRLPAHTLRHWFAVVVLVTAVFIATASIMQPAAVTP